MLERQKSKILFYIKAKKMSILEIIGGAPLKPHEPMSQRVSVVIISPDELNTSQSDRWRKKCKQMA